MRAQHGGRNMAEDNGLSTYAKGLSLKDRECYVAKLTLTNGDRLPDPYAVTEWTEDVSKWPNIQWPDILFYFLEKPSRYTLDKLRAYRSLDAYNYVLCGHVQNVKYSDLNSEFCVLRSDVLPSQRQGHKSKMYNAWVITNKPENYVLTANCTCMAG